MFFAYPKKDRAGVLPIIQFWPPTKAAGIAGCRKSFVTGPQNGAAMSLDKRVMAAPGKFFMRIYCRGPGWPDPDTLKGARNSVVIKCPHPSVEVSNITFTESMI